MLRPRAGYGDLRQLEHHPTGQNRRRGSPVGYCARAVPIQVESEGGSKLLTPSASYRKTASHFSGSTLAISSAAGRGADEAAIVVVDGGGGFEQREWDLETEFARLSKAECNIGR